MTNQEIAHDLQAPLASILGFSELMAGRWDDLTDDQKRAYVQVIERRAHQLAELVETDLALSA
jgi:signal transduction histidine kinase